VGAAAAKIFKGRRQARVDEAFGGNAEATEREPLWRGKADTTPGPDEQGLVSARTNDELRIERRKIAFSSNRAAICRRRDRPIREKIIGRSITVFRGRFSRKSRFVNLRRALPLLHQPARQHGRGIFLHPQVEQRTDLLAEIGGMAETREFIALQRVSGRREEELPTWLSFVMVHAGLLENCDGTLNFVRASQDYDRVIHCGKMWISLAAAAGDCCS
jgi:hypothetical protein